MRATARYKLRLSAKEMEIIHDALCDSLGQRPEYQALSRLTNEFKMLRHDGGKRETY